MLRLGAAVRDPSLLERADSLSERVALLPLCSVRLGSAPHVARGFVLPHPLIDDVTQQPVAV